jgi:hypothetical protein
MFHIVSALYRVYQEDFTILQENVPEVKLD